MPTIRHFVAWGLRHPVRILKSVNADRLTRRFDVMSHDVNGFQLLTIQKKPHTDLHLLFFHGGAYICDAAPLHRRLMTYLAGEMSCKVTYVDYPLAPEHTAENTKAVVLEAYRYIAGQYASDRLCLFGDSSGGGLALALRQLIRDEKIETVPYKTICCSPWLDVSMSCSDYSQQAQTEKLLTETALIDAGRKYAGNWSTRDPFVSPIYGSMQDLGDIFVSVSSDELFLPDVHLLQAKIKAAVNTTLTVIEQPDAIHDYVLRVRSSASQATFQAMKRFLGIA